MQRSRKLFFRSILLGTCVSIFVFFLSMTGYLSKWENGVFDFLMFWETEKRSSDIYLIEINGIDYNNLFHSKSPLSRKVLSEMILKLSGAKPKAIGLDISIEDETIEDNYLIDSLKILNKNKIPIVFPLSKSFIKFAGSPISKVDPSKVRPLNLQLPSQFIFLGAIDYMQSNDGVIREMSLLKDTKHDTWPSFPLALAAAGTGMTWEDLLTEIKSKINNGVKGKPHFNEFRSLVENSRNSPIQKIHFIGDKKSFNTIQFSQIFKMPRESFQPGTIFTDKIILIGGSFEESRDFYMTPKGRLAGVEIIANSIESILRGNPIKSINHILELIFELLVIFVISYFFFRFTPLKASIICFLSIIPLAIIGSALVFSNFSHWLNFIPAGLSVIIHGRISNFEHNVRLRHENKLLSKRLNKQEEEIARLKRLAREKSKKRQKRIK